MQVAAPDNSGNLGNGARPPRGAKRWIIASLMAIALAVILFLGNLRTPTGPAQGTAVEGSYQPPVVHWPAFRVGEFNIAGGVGADGQCNLDRTAAALRGCDLVGLMEVHGRSLFESRDQAQILGQTLNMSWLFAPVERRWWHDSFGNALLTRLPIKRWQRVPISSAASDTNRNLLEVTFSVGDRDVNAIITHLGRHADRDAQMQIVCDRFLRLTPPAILMGDLNRAQEDPLIKKLLETPGVVDAFAGSSPDKTPRHIDWILVRGLRVLNSTSLQDGTSDHPSYRADLEVPSP